MLLLHRRERSPIIRHPLIREPLLTTLRLRQALLTNPLPHHSITVMPLRLALTADEVDGVDEEADADVDPDVDHRRHTVVRGTSDH